MLKIFIVNLKRSVDRRAFMREQIATLASEFEFIFWDAVDAAQNEHRQFANHFTPLWSKLFKGRVLKEGEKACFASHYTLWEKCVQLNEAILILEDDVRFTADFLSGVQDILASGYDFVRLYGNFARDLRPLGGNYHLSLYKTSGACAYYITPEAAKSLLGKARIWFCPVDDLLDLYFYTKVPNIVYQPYLLEHEGMDTTIATQRKGSSGSLWKLNRELRRLFMFIYKQTYLFFNKEKLLTELSQAEKI